MTRHRYRAKLLLGLMHGEHAFAGPSYVNIDLTARCNLNCVGCPFHGPEASLRPPSGAHIPRDLPFTLYNSILTELRALGTPKVHLQGSGEPLLHPEVVRMTAQARQMGFEVMLLTNGTLLNEATCRELLAAGPDTIRVSFWATTPEEFQHNTPGNRSEKFQAALEGLRRLAALRAKLAGAHTTVAARLVVNRHTWTSLERAVEVFGGAGATLLEFHPMHPTTSEAESGADLRLTPESMENIRLKAPVVRQRLADCGMLHNLDWFLERLDLSPPVWQYAPCYTGWFHVRIGYNGDVRTCCMCSDDISVVGNVNAESLATIWNGPRMRTFRRLTRTRKALMALGGHCNCSFCSSGPASRHIQRSFAPFKPLSLWRK